MLVTGSNRSPYDHNVKLSIRLRQDGQFFSVEEALAQTVEQGATVEVMVDGAVCVPFPRKEADRIDLRALLSDAGVPVAEGDGVVVSHSESPVAYAIWVAKEAYERLTEWAEKSGATLTFATPLAGVVARAVVGSKHDKCVVVSRSNGALYVAHTNEHKLLYAEALPVAVEGFDEVLYAMAVLNGDFDLRRADIIIIGMGGKELYKVLRRHFRRCKCE